MIVHIEVTLETDRDEHVAIQIGYRETRSVTEWWNRKLSIKEARALIVELEAAIGRYGVDSVATPKDET